MSRKFANPPGWGAMHPSAASGRGVSGKSAIGRYKKAAVGRRARICPRPRVPRSNARAYGDADALQIRSDHRRIARAARNRSDMKCCRSSP
jgi:hypothetical protein